jgi:Domain of unknown function in PX-proteins (DUF3818)
LVADSSVLDVRNTVQPFIQLIDKHEQNFYSFVHNVHSQDTTHLFDDLLAYIDKLFSTMSTGLPGKVDMAKLVEENLNEEQYAQLKVEINKLCDYHLQRKIRHLERTRRKVLEGTGLKDELAMDAETNIRDLAMAEESNGLGMIQDMEELEFLSDSEMSDDDEEEELYNSDDSVEEEEEDEATRLRKEQQRQQKLDDESAVPPPKLTIIPNLTPAFTRSVATFMV